MCRVGAYSTTLNTSAWSGDAGVQLDDLGERVPVVDPVVLLDASEERIVLVEEPVAVAQRLELLLPDRELQLPNSVPGTCFSETMPTNASTLSTVP